MHIKTNFIQSKFICLCHFLPDNMQLDTIKMKFSYWNIAVRLLGGEITDKRQRITVEQLNNEIRLEDYEKSLE